MGRFTSGTISYGRKVNPGNYEHKEFKAEISWVVDDTEDHACALDMIERASNTAVMVVHKRLGLPDEIIRKADAEFAARPVFGVVPTPIPVSAPAPVKEAVVAETPAQAEERTKRHRATKVEMEERARIKADGDAAKARLSADPLLELTAEMVVDADPVLDDELTALPPDVTDADMQHAAQRKAAQGGDWALKVRKLIGAYAPQMAMIPQERRRKFLDDLGALS